MGRTRSFTDQDLENAWKKSGGIVRDVAAELSVTGACVYLHASRLKLERQTRQHRTTKAGIRSGDRPLVTSFTHLLTVRQYARMNNEAPMVMRRKLLNAAHRLWGEGEYVDFPQPEVPSDIQVFNFLRNIDAGEMIDDCPVREDITYLWKNCKVRKDSVQDYHERYLEHQAMLEEQHSRHQRLAKTPAQKKRSKGQRKLDDKAIARSKKAKKKFIPKRASQKNKVRSRRKTD